MATTGLGTVLGNLRRSLSREHETSLTDSELLEGYIARRDKGAFETLMRRHGPMVFGVCRRILRNEADAEDAFQATFLVLVRKAASIKPRGMVGNWLYGVACTTALKARAMSNKRLVKEREAAARKKPAVSAETWERLQALLDEELKGLPDKYRAAIVLCDLEGKSIKEAARELGCPQGTVGTWLARGRSLLSRRLARHGTVVPGGMIAAAIAQNSAAAGVPPLLMTSTVQAAGAGAASAAAAALAEGVLKIMLMTKLKVVTAMVLMAGLGAWAVSWAAVPAQPPEVKRPNRQTSPAGKEGGPAAADPRKAAGDGGEQITAIWITEKRVQQELRLSEAQVKKLEAVRSEVYRKYEAELKKAREEAKKENLIRYRDLSRKIQADERRALTAAAPEILSAAALNRLRQIQRQARGLHNLVQEPAVQKKLSLNDEQVKQIEGFLKLGLEAACKEAAKRATGQILEPLRIEDHVVFDQKAYAAAMKGVAEVFNPEQRRVWNDLVGEPFAFTAAPMK